MCCTYGMPREYRLDDGELGVGGSSAGTLGEDGSRLVRLGSECISLIRNYHNNSYPRQGRMETSSVRLGKLFQRFGPRTDKYILPEQSILLRFCRLRVKRKCTGFTVTEIFLSSPAPPRGKRCRRMFCVAKSAVSISFCVFDAFNVTSTHKLSIKSIILNLLTSGIFPWHWDFIENYI